MVSQTASTVILPYTGYSLLVLSSVYQGIAGVRLVKQGSSILKFMSYCDNLDVSR